MGLWKIRALFICFVLLIGFDRSVGEDAQKKNKYRERKPTEDTLGYHNMNESSLLNSKCPRNLELRWQTEVSSSIYATPLIADINGDGKLDIVVSTYVHYLEVLDGADGEKMSGWPAFHQSTVHGSPILYDMDKDGYREIVLATYNGEVLFFRASGYVMTDKLQVPRRKIRKNWYVGLNPDSADSSRADFHDKQLVKDSVDSQSIKQTNKSASSNSNTSSTKENGNITLDSSKLVGESVTNGTQEDMKINLLKDNDNSVQNPDVGNKTNASRRLLQDIDSKGSEEVGGSKSGGNDNARGQAASVENDEGLEAEADASFDLLRDNDELPDEYAYDYDDYVDEKWWGDEDWVESQHEKLEDFVDVDAHILNTPVIADIDNDGVMEMVVAASFFFDREYYDNTEHKKELGDIDLSKYMAGSIVVFNLDTKQVKWTKDLDVSVADPQGFQAYIYSSPTVADLDGDGNLDILIGNSLGLFYVIDHQGKVRDNFPLEMADIQGSVIAADVNDDGKLELIATDSHGNVAALNPNGLEIWEVHLKSHISQAPSIGDVDGDGHTDLVIATISGKIFVLNGRDGSIIQPYPYRTYGRVTSQVLLVDLSGHKEKRKGLTIVASSFGGYLYLIDGPTGCADVVDVGEISYTTVLADNVDGGDDLDLIVSTMNGNVFCFSTPSPHHPLKAWRSPNQGRNNYAYRYDREGIYVTPSSRTFRDEEGKNFWVEIEIVDKHRYPSGDQAPYNVTTTLGVPGNYLGERRVVHSQVFDKPGKHKIKFPTVGTRTQGQVIVEMVDKNGLYFSDEFSLTFHMFYYKLLKWLLVLPMLGMFGILVILRPQEPVPLPSFSRNTDL
ncbi:hypothetical protein MLD38_029915 [Melastoma candidum]|uniref:Uncharacterized protein n=1 Tax=Melastoma candidum TaxID=119954 RepID=A0ACB9MLE2_9MYRT|nr:hypothetical protein MLD38_029915 [Melastoma candidum]